MSRKLRSPLVFSVLSLGWLLVWVGCQKSAELPSDPKDRLKKYIETSFSLKSIQDREDLEAFLIGDARLRLAAWSDRQFAAAFVDRKRKFSRLFFREVEPLSESLVNITYELSFFDQREGMDARITNKKMCQMTYRDSEWYIRECRNIKQLVEYPNAMSLP